MQTSNEQPASKQHPSKVIGKLYKLVAEVQVDAEGNIAAKCCENIDGLVQEDRLLISQTLTDACEGRPLPNFERGIASVEKALDRSDLRVIGDALNIRSNGKLLFVEDASYLANRK